MAQSTHDTCLVCGMAAVGINFAVPTCAPCKAFFRRNAVKLGRVDFVCQKDGDCIVTQTYRRMCNCCRLAKCFRVGMQKSLIRSEIEKEARKNLVLRNRQKRTQSEEQKRLQLIRPSNLLYSERNHQSRCLSSLDQTLLTNIFSAYQRTHTATINNEDLRISSITHLSLHTLFNELSEKHVSSINFLRLLPEFNVITMNDKIRLIKNHFGTMIIINVQSKPSNAQSSELALKSVYGSDLGMALSQCIGLIHAYTHDPMLIKLILIVRSLSSSISRNLMDKSMDQVYDNTLVIFSIQNIYIELMWRYLLSRLPTEQDIVKFFNKMILDCLSIVRVSFMLDDFIYKMPDEIEKMAPLMQSMWPRSNV